MAADHWIWLAGPLAAGLLMAMCLVPLGHRVLTRGMVFADLAIAQWAALGSLVGGRLVPSYTLMGIPVTSLILAMLAVALVHLILRYLPEHREATIGLLYVSGASLATLLVSSDPHGAQALARTLDGDLLWVTGSALLPLTAVTVAVLIWQAAGRRNNNRIFLVLFALAVTLTVEMAGIYVVFASLIATPLLLCHHGGAALWWAVVAAAAGHVVGLGLSAVYDLPAGPAVVLALVLAATLSRLIIGWLSDKNQPGCKNPG